MTALLHRAVVTFDRLSCGGLFYTIAFAYTCQHYGCTEHELMKALCEHRKEQVGARLGIMAVINNHK